MIKTKKGFTLVELLVVIAIIGMLSTIAVVSLGSARAKARDAKRIADMRQVSAALEIYYSDQSGYPIYGTAGTGSTLNNMSICATSGISAVCTGTTYMAVIPAYPNPPATTACAATASANYCYLATVSTAYSITYLIESQSDFPGATGVHCTMTPTGTVCN